MPSVQQTLMWVEKYWWLGFLGGLSLFFIHALPVWVRLILGIPAVAIVEIARIISVQKAHENTVEEH